MIDCAKAVAAGRFYEGDPWDLVLHWDRITEALPLLTVLTIAATGSEMDSIAVISNEETQDKMAMKHPVLRPRVSILDPSYTFSVSAYQSTAGAADILSHAMESYFAREEARLQDYFAQSIMKVCIECAPKVLEHPEDYEARANLMWAGSWAINDMLKLGHALPWSVHAIEHQLSAVYDITHGVGLSELGIDETHFEEMAEKAARQAEGSYQPMTKADIVQIYKNSL